MGKFYCQDCGTEVPLEVDTCPKCHKHFGSVLCPKCNYTGSAIKFMNGCPKCGYLTVPEQYSKGHLKEKKLFSLSFKLFLLLFSALTVTLLLMIYLF